jgi:hypothetical protein
MATIKHGGWEEDDILAILSTWNDSFNSAEQFFVTSYLSYAMRNSPNKENTKSLGFPPRILRKSWQRLFVQ